ncbi:hypothetical protein PoB_001990400 [Plakobranchus ocellatus]|uniref:Uncharacterized protein n=1 Tax=Plakobranchus ocellatus TaxID=259542 RepID=A0AAV3ZHN7_9GAST|nr:hypothetical protein PoB_001990400 [Plakobranchus ocellatus]
MSIRFVSFEVFRQRASRHLLHLKNVVLTQLTVRSAASIFWDDQQVIFLNKNAVKVQRSPAVVEMDISIPDTIAVVHCITLSR